MPMFRVTSNDIPYIREQIAVAITALDVDIAGAVTTAILHTRDALRDETPLGIIHGPPGDNPPGDAEGALSTSYVSQTAHTGLAAAIGSIATTQPTKLRYIRYGTGIYGPRGERIYPVRAAALRWMTWGGPVYARSVRGIPPNDFVTPIVARGLIEARTLVGDAVAGALADLRMSLM